MSHLRDTNHTLIRYANQWEDASVLRKALTIRPGDNVLSIASAGDNSFALLLDDPATIVAVDINSAQLFLIELKMAAIQLLSYQECLAFLGFSEMSSPNRIKIYQKLRADLNKEALEYWDGKHQTIESGVIYSGKFEQYFHLFSKRILPLIHSRKTVEQLFVVGTSKEKEQYYKEQMNTWRWRFFFKLFFSKTIMGWLGRDSSFQNEVTVNVSEFILGRAEKILSSEKVSKNFMLRFNLTGRFDPLLPDYLTSEKVYETIKKRLERIQLIKGYIQEAANLNIKFQAMNMSDIFEYMPPELFCKTSIALYELGSAGCRYAYWNLMVDRRMSAILPDMFEYNESIANRLHQIDRGFYYKEFILDNKRNILIT